MHLFLMFWFLQTVSLTTSAMTAFAISFWVFEKTGVATALSTILFCGVAPAMVSSFLAGGIVDRLPLRRTIIISDLASAVGSVAVILLWSLNILDPWHFTVIVAISSFFQPFQWLAFSKLTSALVPKEDLSRAAGLTGAGQSTATILAPVAASTLLGLYSLQSVFIAEIASAIMAVVGIMALKFRLPHTNTNTNTDFHFSYRRLLNTVRNDTIVGLGFIRTRKELLNLLGISLLANFWINVCTTLRVPFVLSITGNDKNILAAVQSAAGIGGILGGIMLVAWKGPKQTMHGVGLGIGVFGVMNIIFASSDSTFVWIAAMGMASLASMLANSCSQTIWMRDVPLDIQGRVFALRRVGALFVAPIATLIAHPKVDLLANPTYG